MDKAEVKSNIIIKYFSYNLLYSVLVQYDLRLVCRHGRVSDRCTFGTMVVLNLKFYVFDAVSY